MRKIIIFLLILLATILFTSCTTQQRVVYRDCDCNTTIFGFDWNTNPYWSWNNPGWGFNNWYVYPYRVIPRYYIQPNRVQPAQPSRYERRQSVGARPSRSSVDNVYPTRTPNIPRIEVRPSQQNSQPSRVQQRTNTPSSNQPTRSRVQNNQ
jgi:hypothetical protein